MAALANGVPPRGVEMEMLASQKRLPTRTAAAAKTQLDMLDSAKRHGRMPAPDRRAAVAVRPRGI